MSIKITTLIENTPGEHLALKNEHGISFYIEKDDYKVLFDTGQSDAFLYNAQQLNIELDRLDYVVLSHGHYDHSGGFTHLTEKTNNFTLITGKGFFDGKYGKIKTSYEYLGNNFNSDLLKKKKIKHITADAPCKEISAGIYVLTSFPRIHKDEIISPRFQIYKDGIFSQDKFEDEIMIVLDYSEGLIVLLGCSHPGMKNMIDAAKNQLKKPVYAVFGGTHLVEASVPSLNLSVNYLQNKDIGIIGMSHCTGQAASEKLKTDKHYVQNRTGSSYFFS